jgi:hypothetical protein
MSRAGAQPAAAAPVVGIVVHAMVGDDPMGSTADFA